MAKYDQEILNAVALRGKLTVTELSEMLGVSDQTIRRIVKPPWSRRGGRWKRSMVPSSASATR